MAAGSNEVVRRGTSRPHGKSARSRACARAWRGSLAACGSSPLGTCEPAIDPGTPPACADGSIPGTIDGRYTGACIPANQCPQLPCDALVTEPACAARADCRAIDRGSDCTCAAAGCSCALRAFDRCEAAPARSGG
jgi:hypothetical protein